MTTLNITSNSTVDTSTTVGQLVAERPGRSRVFQTLGIDFCCGGKMSLAEACKGKGLDPDSVLQVLLASEGSAAGNEVDAAAMGLTELCDHVEKTHHAYLKDELPRLRMMVRKVAAVHGHDHPWTLEIDGVFSGFAAELESHMLKEEQALFPLIRALESGEKIDASHCGRIENAIAVMESEHQDAGNDLERMRNLSSGFTPPPGACNTFRAMLDGLRELEADMHQHVHKENNVMFPRAMAEEKARC